jgi:hypothetical protein
VKELGCLALAVALAGPYVHETPWLSSDLQLYLGEYRAQRKQALSQKARPHEHRYNNSVLSTWEMSLAAVERLSPVAARLLNLVAFLNYDNIFLDLFATADAWYKTRENTRIMLETFKWRKTPTRPNTKSSSKENIDWTKLLSLERSSVTYDTIKSGFKILEAYSLVSWQAHEQAYVMHKLVHAWSHDRLDLEQRQAWGQAASHLLNEVFLGMKRNIIGRGYYGWFRMWRLISPRCKD